MVICLVAECISTYSLDKYEKLQGHIENGYEGSHLYNNDLIDSQVRETRLGKEQIANVFHRISSSYFNFVVFRLY